MVSDAEGGLQRDALLVHRLLQVHVLLFQRHSPRGAAAGDVR